MPIVSIIIVTYNSQKHISQCIHSILKQDLDLELIIVDNNSSDNTRAILKTITNEIEDMEKPPIIKLIYNSQNVGYGKAVNIGAAHANSPYILVLNPDVIIPEGELKKLLNFVENYDAKKFIIAPLSYTEKWSPRWSSFGSFPTYLKIFVDFTVMKLYIPEFLRKILYSGKIKKVYKRKGFIKVDWVSGGAFLIPKHFFEELHGFDERFFLYYEDVDLCKRVWRQGGEVILFPMIRVIHKTQHNRKATEIRKINAISLKSAFYYFEKYSSSSLSNLFLWMSLRITWSVLIILLYLLDVATLGLFKKIREKRQFFQVLLEESSTLRR